jgi:signal transduction histidine kinase
VLVREPGHDEQVRTERIAATDWILGGAVAAALLITGLAGRQPAAPIDYLGCLLMILGGAVLVALSRLPVLVLVISGLCALGTLAAGWQVPALGYLVAVYGTVREGRHLPAVLASLGMMASLPPVLLAARLTPTWGAGFALSRDILPLAWLVAAGAAGEAMRQAVRRAEEAERTVEETARRRADEERLRIARDLHDSLTHQIAVIRVQADVAVHLDRKQGRPVNEPLLVIRDAAREATRELRAALETLRGDTGGRPQGLRRLNDLVRAARAAGLEVTLTVEGEPAVLPAAVDQAGYRIVQESLTNIVRHAAATTASIRIDYLPGSVVIRIEDDGRASPDIAPVSGVGLLGMRERVTALGGRLQAEPRREGGFAVRAELPMEERP